MSLCGVCHSEIKDDKPMDLEHLSYDGCIEAEEMCDYLNR